MLRTLGVVEVLSAHPDSFPAEISSETRIRGFPFSRRLQQTVVKLPVFSVEVAAWATFARLLGRKYQLVYAFQDTSSIAGLLLRGPGTRWVIDVLDDPALELRNTAQQGKRAKALLLSVRDRLFAALVSRADLVPTIGTSPDDILPTILRQKYGVHCDRVLPVSQAIDIEALGSVRTCNPIDNERTVFYVGWVSPLRGVHTLIEAVDVVRRTGMAVHLRLAGYLKQSDAAWLDDLARLLPGLFTYLGELPSSTTLREIAKATVCTCPFPDRPEMAPVQPVKVIEYLALGKPIVASRLPGISALIEEEKSGLLFEPENPLDLAAALLRVLDDDALARSLSIEARARAASFDVRSATLPLAQGLKQWLDDPQSHGPFRGRR